MATKITSTNKRKYYQNLRTRDGDLCWLCGEPMDFSDRPSGGAGDRSATLDHVVPLGRGGSNEQTNLRLAHAKCNNERGCPDIRPPPRQISKLSKSGLQRKDAPWPPTFGELFKL